MGSIEEKQDKARRFTCFLSRQLAGVLALLAVRKLHLGQLDDRPEAMLQGDGGGTPAEIRGQRCWFHAFIRKTASARGGGENRKEMCCLNVTNMGAK